MLALSKKSYDKSREYIKKQRHHFAYSGPYSQSYGFSSSHVQMSELDYEEDWAPKKLINLSCDAGKNPLSLLDNKEIKSVLPKGNQPWI